MTTTSPRYCIRTADGDRICEVVEGPIYNHNSMFAAYIVRAVKGKLNPINRMVVPEWKLSNKVNIPVPDGCQESAEPLNAEELELSTVQS